MSNQPLWDPDLIRLHVRPDTTDTSCDRVVLATARDGFLDAGADHGLFMRETRFLSRYRWLIDGKPIAPVSHSNVTQQRWVGYYLAPGASRASPLKGITENALEVQLSRQVGRHGLCETAAITNFSQKRRRFRLAVTLDADFADLAETSDRRKQHGRRHTRWQAHEKCGTLTIRYKANHRYSHQGERGTASLTCSLRVDVAGDGVASWKDSALHFTITLAPRQTWQSQIDFTAAFEEIHDSGHFLGDTGKLGRADTTPAAAVTRFSSSQSDTLLPVVVEALDRSSRDLKALRLFDLDQADGGWVPAAGLPLYVALFGRDTLTVAWEAAPLTANLMRGTLPALTRWQGQSRDDWRDEETGKMLHEMHTGPLSVLNYIPEGRDYGSVTTSAFYPFVVAQLWHWTGDKALVAKFLEPAARALAWLDRQCADGKGGFCWYQTRSTKGVKNQSWKDSGDAIVYEDGSQVADPIATCEQQGIIYAAKMNFAEVLWWFDRKDEAKRHYREAVVLKRRFNKAFWMEKEGFVALALDPKGRQVRSISSNPLHCVATGIVDEDHVPTVLARLFAADMFSGWGVRTLSADHPAYNPYAYHRGTVWPAEHGPFAVGAYRYGQHDHVTRIARAQFELASLFDHAQLPECVAGHARDAAHPFPPLYPAANAPQAWSATTPFTLLQAILGMQPFAPLKMLFIDPHLPSWLPEITLSGMHVGNATVSIRFYRKANGASDYKVLDKRGGLHILRQPSPWSFTATLAERAGDAFASIFR
jgi:glycogen debranching enzyme